MSRSYRLPRDIVAGDHVAIIDAARQNAGYLGRHTTAGAVALAKWLAADLVRTAAEAARAGSPLRMGFYMDRILAGEVMPANGLIEALGRMTDGAVTYGLFWEQVSWTGALDEAVQTAADVVADVATPIDLPAAPAGRSSQQVGARLVDRGRAVEVNTGAGLSLKLTIAAALAMQASLGKALTARGEALIA